MAVTRLLSCDQFLIAPPPSDQSLAPAALVHSDQCFQNCTKLCLSVLLLLLKRCCHCWSVLLSAPPQLGRTTVVLPPKWCWWWLSLEILHCVHICLFNFMPSHSYSAQASVENNNYTVALICGLFLPTACADQLNSDLSHELSSPPWHATDNYPNTKANLKITAQNLSSDRRNLQI